MSEKGMSPEQLKKHFESKYGGNTLWIETVIKSFLDARNFMKAIGPTKLSPSQQRRKSKRRTKRKMQ